MARFLCCFIVCERDDSISGRTTRKIQMAEVDEMGLLWGKAQTAAQDRNLWIRLPYHWVYKGQVSK